MKKILLLLINTFLFAVTPDQGLLDYQKKYSLCQGKTNYQITKCLLNGNLNYTRFRGDRPPYRKISKKTIKKEEAEGNVYRYAMNLMPKTQRYTGLKEYIDYLYFIKKEYI